MYICYNGILLYVSTNRYKPAPFPLQVFVKMWRTFCLFTYKEFSVSPKSTLPAVLHQILTLPAQQTLKYQYSEYSAPTCMSPVNMLMFVVKLCCQDFVGNLYCQALTIQVLTTRVLDGSRRADRAGWTVGLIKRKIN